MIFPDTTMLLKQREAIADLLLFWLALLEILKEDQGAADQVDGDEATKLAAGQETPPTKASLPLSLYVGAHLRAPRPACSPGGHSWHSAVPLLAAYRPGSQSVHERTEPPGEYLP